MPEIANEIPTHDELQAYWQQHWVRSALRSFEIPPEELMRWYIPEVARAFQSLIRMDGREFARFAYQAILTGLERLNQLPRSHPFWRNTNRRPTIYKLGEFCRLELAIAPGDSELLKAAALLPVWHGSNDFGQEDWLELCRQPGFDLRWPPLRGTDNGAYCCRDDRSGGCFSANSGSGSRIHLLAAPHRGRGGGHSGAVGQSDTGTS